MSGGNGISSHLYTKVERTHDGDAWILPPRLYLEFDFNDLEDVAKS